MVSEVSKFQAAETMVSEVLKVLKVILVDSCVISPSFAEILEILCKDFDCIATVRFYVITLRYD